MGGSLAKNMKSEIHSWITKLTCMLKHKTRIAIHRKKLGVQYQKILHMSLIFFWRYWLRAWMPERHEIKPNVCVCNFDYIQNYKNFQKFREKFQTLLNCNKNGSKREWPLNKTQHDRRRKCNSEITYTEILLSKSLHSRPLFSFLTPQNMGVIPKPFHEKTQSHFSGWRLKWSGGVL
jgi:hypothetical protein